MSLVDNNNILDSVLYGMAPISDCGICEKNNYERRLINWPNHKGSIVHSTCFDVIKFAVQTLRNKIDGLFAVDKAQWKLNNHVCEIAIEARKVAQVKAISAVRRACGTNLRAYVALNGIEALREHCNTVGIDAAIQYADQRRAELLQDMQKSKL
ncbi:MAG: hypothetical protein JSR46_03155 [Verrucomicrobia bacterium]|nr:hypothetical protein [Verrucomicrobiota bacterium]